MFATRYGEVSGVQAEKLQRLRVNRVAIIQALRVEHVMPHLLAKRAITEEDKKVVISAKTTHDKARRLIDILPNKSKEVDWYGKFKEALKNPHTRSNETKKKYQILVDFLDNTILPSQHRNSISSVCSSNSSSSMKLPRYDPLPGILDSESPEKNGTTSQVTFEAEPSPEYADMGDETNVQSLTVTDQKQPQEQHEGQHLKQRKMLLKGYFHKWVTAPENFESLIENPQELLQNLRNSSDPEDISQLNSEQQALEKVKNIEVVLALKRLNQLPEGFEICMSSAAEEFLADPDLFHMYIKYFQQLTPKYDLNIPLELAVSFGNLFHMLEDTNDEESQDYIIKLGFGLFELLCQNGMYDRAEIIMTNIVVHLSKSSEISAWMATWEALVKLLTIRNTNMNFRDADAVHTAAKLMAEKIDLMSFGKELLDKSEMYVGLSTLMREQGSIGPSYSWAQEAIKEVVVENHHGIVDVLCNASLAYGNKLNVKKAEELVMHSVQYARKHYGSRHPLYVRALLHFCHFSSEFRQDQMGVEVARKALETCEKMYGSGMSIQSAQAHQALARALAVSQQFTDEEYYNHAFKAWRMSLDVLPATHPRLALFRFTLAQCLLWRASHGDDINSLGSLIWAETEARGALAIFKTYWGEFSLKVAQGYALLGQIRTKLGNVDDAEKVLKENVYLHQTSFPKNSHYTHLARATLGAFYKTVDKPLEALDLLREVVDQVDCGGVYLKWVHVCFDTVIELLNAINHEKDAAMYQANLVDWMQKNSKPSHQVTWDQLHAEPKAHKEFCRHFGSWQARLEALRTSDNKLKED